MGGVQSAFETRRQRQELLRDLKKLLELGTEDDFVAAMRALGLRDDSPGWSEILRIWSEYRSWRRPHGRHRSCRPGRRAAVVRDALRELRRAALPLYRRQFSSVSSSSRAQCTPTLKGLNQRCSTIPPSPGLPPRHSQLAHGVSMNTVPTFGGVASRPAVVPNSTPPDPIRRPPLG